jgi:carboxypeptidase C (cathepsin A)
MPGYRVLIVGSLMVFAGSLAQAQREPVTTPPATPASPEKPATPVPPEKNSVTSHEITLGGKPLRYAATAGNILIKADDDQPNASVFYVAYTVDGVTDTRSRPLTFLYNGGPGSASMWLHMGSIGPVRVLTASPEATGPGPYQVVPNQYSLLDKSDLVFVDAVGTGYSRR